jgi:DNA-directed RNA polymerase subunit K/omega
VIQRPTHIGAFQFVVVASLRAAQLTRGCLPKVDGVHKVIVTAQLEVSEGRIAAVEIPPAVDVPK